MSDESEDQWLSGCPISQELEVSQLSGTDSFLVSVPTNGKLESNFWRSRKVSYDTIRDDIYAGLFGNIGLGSMASADVSAYAPRSHAHFGRYSIVSVEQHYRRNPDIQDEFADSVIVLGHVVVDGTSYDVCVPKLDQYAMAAARSKIGTLKFLALPNMPQIDESAADFDGWTYPDGRFLQQERFPDAYAVFGDVYGPAPEGMFALPVLSDFMKMNPYAQQHNATERIPYNVGLKQHTHAVSQMRASGQFELTASFNNYKKTDTVKENGQKWNPYTGYLHGTPDPESDKINTTVSFTIKDIKMTGGTSTENDPVDGENHPSYNAVPVLIYVGRPKK